MQLFLLAVLTMTAFASNSILNRLGVAHYGTDPILFAVVRTAAGCVVLWVLVMARSGGWPQGGWGRRLGGATSLALYMAGFSLAYLSLDAGVGALVLFGGVQLTMFAGALWSGDKVSGATFVGCGLAFVGLCVLVWPTEAMQVDLTGAAFMSAAALGWGLYSLLGRGEARPLAATAANFIVCLPMLLPLLMLSEARWTFAGIIAACVAGGLTSGLGYALWYRVLPRLGAARAAVMQLSVPVIAALGGVIVLSEGLDWRFVAAAVLVLGGITLSLRKSGPSAPCPETDQPHLTGRMS